MDFTDSMLKNELEKCFNHHQLDGPLKAASTTPRDTMESLSIIPGSVNRCLVSPPCPMNNISTSSLLKTTPSTKMANSKATEATSRPSFTSQRETKSPTKRTNLGILPNPSRELEKQNRSMGITTKEEAPLPLKLLELSLESPIITSRPSIDLPSTFSRLPSERKKAKKGTSKLASYISSPESFFIAATQFKGQMDQDATDEQGLAVSELESETELKSASESEYLLCSSNDNSTFNIPPTQYGAGAAQPSQAIELFPTSQSQSTNGGTLYLSNMLTIATVTRSEAKFGASIASTNADPSQELKNEHGVNDQACEYLPASICLTKKEYGNIQDSSQNPFIDVKENILSGTFDPPALPLTPIATDSPIEALAAMDTPNNAPHATTPMLSFPTTAIPAAASIQVETFLNSPTIESKQKPSAIKRSAKKIGSATPSGKRVKFASIPRSSSSDNAVCDLKDKPTKSTLIGKTKIAMGKDGLFSQKRSNSAGIMSDGAIPSSLMIPDGCKNEPDNSTIAKGRKRKQTATRSNMSLSATIANAIASIVEPSMLMEQMLVWARWRPQYYSPAILQTRLSRTRELWKVRFVHWKSGSSRSVTLSSDHIVPCLATFLNEGDSILVVKNRKKMQLLDATFQSWLDIGTAAVKVPGHECEQVDLHKIVIVKKLFLAIKEKEQQRQQQMQTQGQYSLISEETLLLSDANFHYRTKVSKKKKKQTDPNLQLFSGLSFWITMGGGLTPAAKRTQKSQIINSIKLLGGNVLADDYVEYGDSGSGEESKSLLLANGYFRTAKIFLAIVTGIPLISIDWLEACRATKSLVPTSTYSIDIPEFTPRLQGYKDFLANQVVCLEGSNKFKSSWKPVCEAAGAIIAPSFTKLGSEWKRQQTQNACTIIDEMVALSCTKNVNSAEDSTRLFILTEQLPSSSSRLVRFGKENAIPIYTIDWLINSITIVLTFWSRRMSGSLLAFLISEFQQLSNETRKKCPDVKLSIDELMASLKAIQETVGQIDVPSILADRLDIATVLLQILDCPLSGRLLPQIINISHRLISHSAFPNTPETLLSILRILKASSSNTTDDTQLRGLQCVMPLLTQYECHGNILYKAYEVCFHIASSKNVMVINAAIAIIRQLMIWLFERVLEEMRNAMDGDNMKVTTTIIADANGNEILCPVKKDGNENIILRLRPFAADAYVILQDICLLANDQKALMLPMVSIQKSFALELVESVLAYNAIVFKELPVFAELIKERLCTLAVKKLSESNIDFSLQCRLWRVVEIILKEFSDILPLDVDVFASLMAKKLDKESELWEAGLVVELAKDTIANRNVADVLLAHDGNRVQLLSSIVSVMCSNLTVSLSVGMDRKPLKTTQALLKMPLLQQFEKASPPLVTTASLLLQCTDFFTILLTGQRDAPNVQFFEFIWAPIAKALILILGTCQLDEEWRRLLLQSISMLARIVAICKLDTAVDFILRSLVEISLPEFQQASSKSPASLGSLLINQVNLTTSVTILNIALDIGEYLGQSWIHVMHVIHGNDQFNILQTKRQPDPNQAIAFSAGKKNTTAISTHANKTELDQLGEIADLERQIMEKSCELTPAAFNSFLSALCQLSMESMAITTTTTTTAISTTNLGANNLRATMLLFPVQKIKQVSLFNIKRFVEVKDEPDKEINSAWNHLIELLTVISTTNDSAQRGFGCETINLLLTQFASSVEPSTHYKDYPILQKRLFMPLEVIASKSSWHDIHKTVLEIINRLLQLIGPQITIAWPMIFKVLGITVKDDDAPLIRNAFTSVKLITGEFLSNLDEICLGELIELLTRFASLKIDLNISLTSVGLLWDVADHIRQRRVAEGSSLFPLWLSILKRLVDMVVDSRSEIRNSSVQTLIRTIEIGGDSFTTDQWESICREILVPLMETVPEAAKTGMLIKIDETELTHHSRDTAEKQWDETLKHLLQGIVLLFTRFLSKVFIIDGFEECEWTRMLALIFEPCQVAKSSELLSVAMTCLVDLAESTDQKAGEYNVLWTKTWTCWHDIGEAMQKVDQNCRAYTQDSLLTYVKCFSSLYKSRRGRTEEEGEDVVWLESSMLAIDYALQCPTPSDPIKDVDAPTELQTISLKILDSHSNNQHSLYLGHLAGWLDWIVELPNVAMGRGGGGNSGRRSRVSTGPSMLASPKPMGMTTFIGLAFAVIERIKQRFTEWADDEEIYESGKVKLIIKSLGRIVVQKYHMPTGNGQLSLVKMATKALNAILVVAMSKPFAQKLWPMVVDLIEKIFESNQSMIPNDLAMDQLDADEEFDIAQLSFFRDTILPIMKDVDEGLIKRIILSTKRCSKLYIKENEEEEDKDGENIDGTNDRHEFSVTDLIKIKPVIKEKLAVSCLGSLFTICSDRTSIASQVPACNALEKKFSAPVETLPASIRRVALPILLDRCKRVMEKYCMDKLLLGRMPFPRIRQDEMIYILQQLVSLVLLADLGEDIVDGGERRKLLNGKRGHLFYLYPQLVECIKLEDTAVVGLVQKAFALIGLELNLIPK